MLKLQAVDLSKSYRGRKIVDDLGLEIGQGEVVGLLGPNGAGKTTTFYILVGSGPARFGRVLLDGDDITDLPMYLRARSGISYLPQEPSVFRQLTRRGKSACRSGDSATDARATARPARGVIGADGIGNSAIQPGLYAFGRASGAGWKLRGPWFWNPPSCSWTSRFPELTRSPSWTSRKSSRI